MNAPPADTQKLQKPAGLQDFVKLIEELKALKTRSQSLDSARLEDQHNQARDAAIKAVEKKVGRGSSEDIVRLQNEAKKIVDAEHERSKEILLAKFSKIEAGLAQLSRFLNELGPVREQEARVQETEGRLRKLEEEIRLQRKVLVHEQEELELEKTAFKDKEAALVAKNKELEHKLERLDVVNRAEELDVISKDLDEKLTSYGDQEMLLEKQREELNIDFDKLGSMKAQLETEAEKLVEDRELFMKQKSAMGAVVAKELAVRFESFLTDMLTGAKPPEIKPAPKPAPSAAADPAPEAAAPPVDGEPPPKKSDFWQ